MSKKVLSLISFVLVLSLVTSASAYDTVVWDKGGGTTLDRLWDNVDNWDKDGGGPEKVPEAGDWAVLSNMFVDDGNGPIIQAGIDAACEWVDFGYSGTYPLPSVGDAVLTMTGGTLTTTTYITLVNGATGSAVFNMTGGAVSTDTLSIGEEGAGTGTFNMDGGTVDVTSSLWLGWQGDVGAIKGILNMTGGTINVADDVLVGEGDSATFLTEGDINMTAGDINIVDWIEIGGWTTDRLGNGHIDLHGGTISAGNLSIGGGGVGTIDITDGVLIIDGDLRGGNGWLFDPCSDTPSNYDEDVTWGTYTGTPAILVERGLITAFDVNSGEIVTGGRAIVNVDYDVTNPGKTTLSASLVDPNLAWNPNPASGAVIPPVTLISWSPGDNAASHEVYFGTSFNDVNDATTASDPNIYRGSQPLADVNYTPPETLTWGTTYFWRVDEVNNPTWKGIVWSFAIPPATASNPSPDDGAEDVPPIVVLSWTPGAEAVTHEVYLSSDFNDVNDRDPCVLTTPGPNYYDPGPLECSTLYYWAVDEVNLDAAVPRWYGDIWSFTTADYLIVDEFDSYADTTALRAVWKDYYSNPSGLNRAEVFVETARDLVHDGNSMRYYYRNFVLSGKYYSSTAEASTTDLEIGTDWTASGAKALVLYFYGGTLNGQEAHKSYHITNDQMWVSLEDGSNNEGIVRYPDMNAVMEEHWHEWNISLQDPCFSGVDMNNVAKVYIGFGGIKGLQPKGGSAGAGANDYIGDTVWFDDIRVWPPRCRPEKVATDFTGDCITNFADVQVMSDDWLLYDYNTIAVAPSGPNLIGWWKFDEGDGNTVADSSGYGHDGVTVDDTPSWVAGYPNDPCDSAMYFDGLSDYVVCAERDGNNPGIYDANLMPDKFTVSCWTKLYDFLYFSSFVGNGIDTGGNECGFFFYNWGWEGDDGPDFGLAIRIEGETSMTYVETLPIYDTKRWYHLAATYDGQYVNIYVDGAPAAGPEDVGGPILWISPDTNNYPGNFTIGSWEDPGYSLHVDGVIDEVRFYDYPLSQGEIAILAELVAPGVEYYQPVPSPANLTDPEAKFSRKVNFRDYVILADHWLEGPTLWP